MSSLQHFSQNFVADYIFLCIVGVLFLSIFIGCSLLVEMSNFHYFNKCVEKASFGCLRMNLVIPRQLVLYTILTSKQRERGVMPVHKVARLNLQRLEVWDKTIAKSFSRGFVP